MDYNISLEDVFCEKWMANHSCYPKEFVIELKNQFTLEEIQKALAGQGNLEKFDKFTEDFTDGMASNFIGYVKSATRKYIDMKKLEEMYNSVKSRNKK